MTEDQYWSVARASEGLYREKGSKFIAFMSSFKDRDAVNVWLDELKQAHPKSRHVCYAYRFGPSGDDFRVNDDGEPSGTAGRPIMGVLKSNEISDVACAVVRYFGGKKLGASGLIHAYKTSAEDAFANNERRLITLTSDLNIAYNPKEVGRLYKVLKRLGYQDIKQDVTGAFSLVVTVSRSQVDLATKQILAGYHGYGIESIGADFVSEDLEIS